MDDDVIRNIFLIEMNKDNTIYKTHYNIDEKMDIMESDEFLNNLMIVEDYINYYFDINHGIIKSDMLLDCHFIYRDKSICNEKEEYPKKCIRCEKSINYNDRFKKCIKN